MYDATTIKKLFRETDSYVDNILTVTGWIRSNRPSKRFGFIEINDGSFFENLQIVYDDNLDNFEEISKLNKKVSDMNFSELREYIYLKESQGRETFEERVKLHQRISIPFASFIFALLAAPLGIKPGRSSGSAVGLGLSIIVIFIYYILMTVGDAVASQGTVAPWLGAWLQNIVFLIIGSVLLYRVAR